MKAYNIICLETNFNFFLTKNMYYVSVSSHFETIIILRGRQINFGNYPCTNNYYY